MKRQVIAGLAAVTLAATFAGAAQAQPYGQGYGYGPGHGYGYGHGIQAPREWHPIERRIMHIDRQIERGLQRGDLTRREAVFLRRDLDSLIRLERQYAYTGRGLSYAEMADLDRRFDVLAQRVRFERRDPEGRWDRWDRDDRYSDYDDDDRRYRRY